VVDVTVTNPDQQSDTLASAYTYTDSSGVPDVRLHFYHNDHLGTPLYLTNGSGTVVWEGLYKPFGEIYYEDTDPDGDGANVYQPFRFPGQVEDFETGLYYNYFRDYDSQLGRYIEPDSLGLIVSINLFDFANNSPIINYDPDGKAIVTTIVVATAIGGVVYKAIDIWGHALVVDSQYQQWQALQKYETAIDCEGELPETQEARRRMMAEAGNIVPRLGEVYVDIFYPNLPIPDVPIPER
jgi:RHS repeat-associated protein